MLCVVFSHFIEFPISRPHFEIAALAQSHTEKKYSWTEPKPKTEQNIQINFDLF